MDKRTETINIRMTKEERLKLQTVSLAKGLNESTFLRMAFYALLSQDQNNVLPTSNHGEIE